MPVRTRWGGSSQLFRGGERVVGHNLASIVSVTPSMAAATTQQADTCTLDKLPSLPTHVEKTGQHTGQSLSQRCQSPSTPADRCAR